MTDEKRIDPETGAAVTFKELSAAYKKEYNKSEIQEYWDECKPATDKKSKGKAKEGKTEAKAEPKAAEPKAKAKATAKAKEESKPEPKAKAKAKAKASAAPAEAAARTRSSKDGGANALARLTSFSHCVLAEYVWLDAAQVPRSKTMTLTSRPEKVADLRVWNFDGSSTGQAEGHNSEVLLKPRAIFNDPFRGAPHVLVLADCWNAWDDKPAIGNTRQAAYEVMNQYKTLDPWFGIEQEYTLMAAGRVGEESKVPLGFNKDGSEPAPQGPYYTGAGTGIAIGRPVAEEHLMKCLQAGVKVSGINSEVMPGQWEFQVGPCRGIEMGDHLTIARYIIFRVTEHHGVVASFSPKPMETGDWNGAGLHTNFSIAPMRKEGGYEVIIKVCEAFGKVAKEHIAEYGENNDKRLTGKHETCSINEFKYGVANRGASIRIPRDAEKSGKGYMEDRRPGANADPYRVTRRVLLTAGDALAEEEIAKAGKKNAAFVFIKSHARYPKVMELVKETLVAKGITIISEGQIKAEKIDKKKLIDVHYGAIAAKATKQKPEELTVQEKAQNEFKTQFGIAWSDALAQGLVFNAVDGAKKLGITPTELGEKYDKLKKGESIIKFGGGFYVGKVDDIFVINGFYMAMRAKFTTPGTSIQYYEVEWDVEKLSWASFRGEVLGPTNPAEAPAESLRGLVYSKWEELGLEAKPDTGDNAVHASASPFEGLAERANWLGQDITRDFFGKAILLTGVSLNTVKDWTEDPIVQYNGTGKSLFDILEDKDSAPCLELIKTIAASNK